MPNEYQQGTLHVFLPPDVADIVRRLADQEDRSMVNLVKRAIVTYAKSKAS